MKVKVKVFGQFRYITNCKEVEVDAMGDAIKDVINSLIAAYPELGPAILSGEELRPYVNLLVNGKNVKDIGGFAATVKEDDDIILFPPMAGG